MKNILSSTLAFMLVSFTALSADLKLTDAAFTDLSNSVSVVTSLHSKVNTVAPEEQFSYATAVCKLVNRADVSNLVANGWGELEPYMRTVLTLPSNLDTISGVRLESDKCSLAANLGEIGSMSGSNISILLEVVNLRAFSKRTLDKLSKAAKLHRIKMKLPIVTKNGVNPIEQDVAGIISACNAPYFEGLDGALRNIGVTYVSKALLDDLKARYENKEDYYLQKIEEKSSATVLKYMYGLEAYNELVKALNGDTEPTSADDKEEGEPAQK